MITLDRARELGKSHALHYPGHVVIEQDDTELGGPSTTLVHCRDCGWKAIATAPPRWPVQDHDAWAAAIKAHQETRGERLREWIWQCQFTLRQRIAFRIAPWLDN